MAEVLELPRGTQRQLSPHFAKKVRNKFHGGGFSATSASEDAGKRPRVLQCFCGVIGFFFFTGKDLRKAAYQELGLDYLAHGYGRFLRLC